MTTEKLTDSPLVWIDLEMTGLNLETDVIIEIAVVITDSSRDLNRLTTSADATEPDHLHLIIHQDKSVMDNMNDWCKEHHGKSGLTAEIPGGTPLAEVEKELIALAGRHYSPKTRIVIAGNSIGNDRRFIDRYLPEFTKLLHYRMIDVSSFKEIYREKYKLNFNKANAHRALGDIYESIKELKFYLSFVQIPEKK
jgi:oligoribonuclease